MKFLSDTEFNTLIDKLKKRDKIFCLKTVMNLFIDKEISLFEFKLLLIELKLENMDD